MASRCILAGQLSRFFGGEVRGKAGNGRLIMEDRMVEHCWALHRSENMG